MWTTCQPICRGNNSTPPHSSTSGGANGQRWHTVTSNKGLTCGTCSWTMGEGGIEIRRIRSMGDS